MKQAIVLDTEATGTDPEKDQIIEAAWLRVDDDPIAVIHDYQGFNEKFRQLYKPDVPMGYGAQAVHNILMSDLDDMPHPSTFMLPDGIEYAIGHNIDFDLSMIGNPTGLKRICTLALSRFLFPDVDSHKQSAMLYMFARAEDARSGLTTSERDMRESLKNAHAALDDVLNCTVLLQYLLLTAMERDHDVSSWEEVWNLSEKARVPTRMGFGKHQGDLIEDVPPIYVNWYVRQPKTDPYYMAAFRKAGFIR